MAKIAEITSQNPWWSQGEDFYRYDRNLSQASPIFFERKELPLKKGNIYILRGPRQVGKTTYLKDLVRKLVSRGILPRDILYLSLDLFTSRRELRNAIQYFLETRRDAPHVYLLLDEITSIDDWNLELKFMADQGLLNNGTLIATGSSAVKLKQKAELLPGRGLEGNEYYIKPLNFREFAIQSIDFISEHLSASQFQNALLKLKPVLLSSKLKFDRNFDDMRDVIEQLIPFKTNLGYLFRLYLTTGGLPGVINHYFLNRFSNQKDQIENAIAEIFIRDVVGDLTRFQKQEAIGRQMLKAIISRFGSRYSFSNLSREIERNHITTIDYLDFMEDSFICFSFYAYDFNTKSIKSKGDKKVYFFDPFVFHSIKSYLQGEGIWNVINRTFENEELLSTLVEGIAISHLRLQGEAPFLRSADTFLWFYYDKSGKEIDIIFKGDGISYGIEVKYQNQVSEKDVKRIVPIQKYFLLSKEDFDIQENLYIIPVDIFLALILSSENNL
ncbi:MAG: ATP-binding protein [candidate division KSB1 bacterium]|nr:ATP-binding protein [candidate division KSB1 bacterium]